MLEAVAATRAPEELVGEADVPAHGADGGGAAVHGEMGWSRAQERGKIRKEYQGQKMGWVGGGGRGEGWTCRVRTEEGPRRIKYERERERWRGGGRGAHATTLTQRPDGTHPSQTSHGSIYTILLQAKLAR